ncbi:N-hydroxyarylamine O-acetyltransferase [Fodinibius roseus]|uniref:N-hydroxyarylamine O-acetyltransferase n=1 Tax=Fodinibius roseus TaxID=1194090 RepID=A0A1M4YQC6_9BACT|nr:arylamine N-acetyltransferase [Fodinibius roseus]SHF07847.1 N-hydroxyarylamine O-acetyltransferase [Fodinibius roseus]
MSTSINLDNYFERIGYEGPDSPTLDTLKTLHRKHTENIPFENLNPFLGMEVKLDPQSLEQKMIPHKRGGYCFEQNLLFREVLRSIGFDAQGLAARIRWNRPEVEISARGHMLLLIEIDDQKYIADVGFGGLTLTAPLRLETGIIQETPHEPYRLDRKGEDYLMQTLVRDEWKDVYQFNLVENYVPDYEITNWYLSNHPESHFVTGLIAARPVPGRRYALRDNRFSIHHLNGETEKQPLETTSEIREVLETHFLLSLPEENGLDKKLSQLIEDNGN